MACERAAAWRKKVLTVTDMLDLDREERLVRVQGGPVSAAQASRPGGAPIGFYPFGRSVSSSNGGHA